MIENTNSSKIILFEFNVIYKKEKIRQVAIFASVPRPGGISYSPILSRFNSDHSLFIFFLNISFQHLSCILFPMIHFLIIARQAPFQTRNYKCFSFLRSRMYYFVGSTAGEYLFFAKSLVDECRLKMNDSFNSESSI